MVACTGALYYVSSLFFSFRGGTYGAAYVYYFGAATVLWAAFAVKIALGFMGILPVDYGVSLRDIAIIIALALFVLGLRRTRNFWDPSKQKSKVTAAPG